MEINSIPFSIRAEQGGDRLTWAGANRGDFDLNHAYSIAMGCGADGEAFSGQWVWKLEILHRIKTFIWQCVHNSIGVGECLARRIINVSDVCPLCQRDSESILHRLRDCEAARSIWCHLGINETSNFYEGSLGLWLEKNCKDNRSRVSNQPPWKIVFPFAIWLLWKNRIEVVFKNHCVQSNVHEKALFSALEFQHCVDSKNFRQQKSGAN